MKYIITLALILVSLAFAGNCTPMTDETKAFIKNDIWDRSHQIVMVNRGLTCDEGYFWYGVNTMDFDICTAYIVETRTQHALVKLGKISLKSTIIFDEYNMPIDQIDEKNTKMTCEQLYKNFKKIIK